MEDEVEVLLVSSDEQQVLSGGPFGQRWEAVAGHWDGLALVDVEDIASGVDDAIARGVGLVEECHVAIRVEGQKLRTPIIANFNLFPIF